MLTSSSTQLILQTSLSFLIGATIVVLATTLAERLGSNLGGVIGGMPSTIVVALFFVALVSGEQAAAQAASIMPLVMAYCGLFLVFYAFLSQKLPSLTSILLALLFWLIISVLAYLVQPLPIAINLGLFLASFALCTWLVLVRLRLPTSQGRRISYSLNQLLVRGVLAGTVIAVAVLAAKLSGPVLSAILSGFPAIMSTSMWIAARYRGVAYSHALVTPLLFSCMINVTLYALVVYFAYPAIGMIWGSLLAYASTLISGYVVFRSLKKITANSPVLVQKDI